MEQEQFTKSSEMVPTRNIIPKVMLDSFAFAAVGLNREVNLDVTSTTAYSDSEPSIIHG